MNAELMAIASTIADAARNARRAADRLETYASNAKPVELPRLRHERTRLLSLASKLEESVKAVALL